MRISEGKEDRVFPVCYMVGYFLTHSSSHVVHKTQKGSGAAVDALSTLPRLHGCR